ncbi:MAG TPA: glycerophosphodiester phosphodiesterase family protein [Lacunisphaera sp.]
MMKPGKLIQSLAGLAVLLAGVAAGHAQVTRPAVTPRVVGHRGLEHHAPENTVANFKASLQLHVGIEVDVRRSKDGVWVCLHDESLDRTTNGRGRAADQLYADLRRLDAGSHLAPYYTGEPIAAFEELLVLLKEFDDPSVMVAVDLKVTDATAEKELVGLARRHGVLDRLVFIGLTIVDPAVRARLRAADPDTQISVLAQTPADVPAALADPHGNWAYLRFVPDPETVKAIHAAGRKVFVVGNMVVGLETDNWRRAQAAGVDGIMTEFPLECRRALHFRNP